MLRRRMMMAQGGVSLPAGYTKIEYLESDGNSYIDTGFKPNQDTRVNILIEASGISGEVYAYGARSSSLDKVFLCALEPSVITIGYNGQYPAYDTNVSGVYNIDHNKNICHINGAIIEARYETFSSNSSLTLFGRNTGGNVEKLAAIKLYSCSIWDNGTLVRDFIPCTNPDGISGLWDSANDVFYKLLPADYTKLDFIETDGTTYIDTGFKPNQDTRVVMDVHLLSTTTGDGYPMAFGVYTDNSNRFSSFWNASKWQVWFGNYGSTTSSPNIERVKIDLSKDQYIVGDVSLPVSSASFTSNRTLYLLAMNQGDVYYVSQARLYSCQIYDNGILVRDFIPAMNASGEAGLYDLKNDVWYALLPVAKPKVENKISTWETIHSETPDGYILFQESGLQSEYPVASDITVTANVVTVFQGRPSVRSRNFTIPKGANNTGALLSGGYYEEISTGFLGGSPIESISPTEDDTYIYTF